MQSRSISAASPSSYRRTPATARRTISRRWRTATSMPMWRPAGPETPLPAPLQVSPPPRSSRRNRQANRRASRQCARRLRPAARQPLPAAQAAARAGVRTDQTGPRFPPVPAARLRKSARRVGHRLHRPQPPQAGPEEESVRNVADGRLSRPTGLLPRRRIMKRPRSRKYRIQRSSLAQQKNRRHHLHPIPPPFLTNQDNLDGLLAPTNADHYRTAPMKIKF